MKQAPTSPARPLADLFSFLREHHHWNLEFQRREYWCNLGHCRTGRERLQSLLNMAVNTQSSPKLGKLAPFWRAMHEFSPNHAPTRAEFCEFLESRAEVAAQGAGPWERLFHALSAQEGWGKKTAALFVKSAIVVHAGAAETRFWREEGDISPTGGDRVYVPVDRVILHIFERLGFLPRVSFDSINRLLTAHYSPSEMLIWDDLWFWGFFTQDSQGEERAIRWNSDKFWCQRASPVGSENEVKSLASRFVGLLR